MALGKRLYDDIVQGTRISLPQCELYLDHAQKFNRLPFKVVNRNDDFHKMVAVLSFIASENSGLKKEEDQMLPYPEDTQVRLQSRALVQMFNWFRQEKDAFGAYVFS